MLREIKEVQKEVEEIVRIGEETIGSELSHIHKIPEPKVTRDLLHSALSPYVLSLISSISGDTDYIQSSPNIRLHMPGFPSAIPFHSDVLYGHSPNEINYWLLLTKATSTNSLWICDQTLSTAYHDSLINACLTLDEFERLAKPSSKPIESDHPALFSFCCAQVHGSVLNQLPLR